MAAAEERVRAVAGARRLGDAVRERVGQRRADRQAGVERRDDVGRPARTPADRCR